MTILVIIVVLVGVFCAVAAMQPTVFTVTRSANMAAPPEKIFEQVNNLQKWNDWSPWVKLDPNTKTTFEGPPAGVGAVMRWAGNMQVGVGSLTITESRPSSSIKLRLDFLKPMQAVNTAEFAFTPTGNQTSVTWSMRGERNFIAKAMGLFMNCEKMVGGQFEKGLASIKSIVER